MSDLMWGQPLSTSEYDSTVRAPEPAPYTWEPPSRRPRPSLRCYAPWKVRYDELHHGLQALLVTVEALGEDATWSVYLCSAIDPHWHVGHRRGREYELSRARGQDYDVEEARRLLAY